uniref:Uncharacterized protein n=1 Tax=Siphoviridae sp. ctAvy12 TaxID=2825371 RepID=A0A8S5USA3_9CAUD|nr:MAG TPA: hypothetical protein [Siphoviridae sp. ctAvy12]
MLTSSQKMWPVVWVLRPLPQVAMRLFDGQESVNTWLIWVSPLVAKGTTTSTRTSSTAGEDSTLPVLRKTQSTGTA